MQAGVSTACLYPDLTEEALYNLVINGISHVEIFINSDSELRKPFIRNLADIMKRYGTTCRSLHPFACPIEPMMLFSRYERRMTDMLEYYKKHFEMMNLLGADIFVLHGNFRICAVSVECYCERFEKLVRLGRESGIIVAQENVERCQSGSLRFLREMVKILGDDARFVLDIKQAVRAGENPIQMLHTLGNRVCHIHMSDHRIQAEPKADCLVLGAGEFKIRNFLEHLAQYRPDASVMLELYRENFRGISDLVSSYRMLARMISGIEKNRQDAGNLKI
ncbi:MAG: sugar phosphate isomerase/epimerase [Oscillospiraceae bacterium]|nr:sugar phosphate isomerase/epimerase [Oscillospiraceae bacterium]